MKKSRWSVLSAFLFTLFSISPVFACQYNVRETGFVDLGTEPYVLCGYVDGNTPADVTTAFKEVADAGLAQSNVVFRLVDIDKQKDHPAIKHFDPNTQTVPCAVLISPDGQTKAIDVPKPGGLGFEKLVGLVVDRVVRSPVRSRLLAEAAKNYGAIMVIEGPNAEENEKAKKEAAAAIKAVKSQMEYLPKEIANPPSYIVMDANSVHSERILLWSLGLDASDVNEPLAIIVYGRGRWIGPLFRGAQVNEDDLASVLFVVGADCECGMDYRWLQGTMLPAKWDRKLHETAAESLGFDPENPMIKMEMSSIIGRGMGGYRYPGTAMGYQELIIEPETNFDEPPSGDLSEPNVVADAIEQNDYVRVEEVTDDTKIEEKVRPRRVEDANKPVAEEKAASPQVGHSSGGMPDPNIVKAMFQQRQGEKAEVGGENKDVYGSISSLAMLAIGLFALVVIFGVVILARARRV